MPNEPRPSRCPDCGDITRRDFLKTTAAGAALAAIGTPRLFAQPIGAPLSAPVSETLATALYRTLTEEQRKAISFPFDDPLRLRVDNNWRIVDKRLGQILTPEQQDLVRYIFRSLHSPEYCDAVVTQVDHDNFGEGGFGGCAVAFFGTPGSGKFEFVLTGRHVTRRCDGDSVEGAAFGGPIFYGHAHEDFFEKPSHPGNIYWYQAKRANELFQALDGKQRDRALIDQARREEGTKTVELRGASLPPAGLLASDLSPDQKQLLRRVMADVLAPFRKPDVDETLRLIDKNGGLDSLAISFSRADDVGSDGIWDVWQIEGPAMLWYFRGAPHVHTWVNVQENAPVG